MHPTKLPTFSAHPPPCLPSVEPSVRKQALTHHSAGLPSDGAPPGGFENAGPFVDNERLEFVGDSILYSLAAELLFREFPRLTQSYLSKIRAALVTNELLAHWCTLYGLDTDLVLGVEHEHLRTNTKVRGDTFEAYVAAVRLYRGSEICTTWLFALMRPYAHELYDFYKRLSEQQQQLPQPSHHRSHARKRSLSAAPTLSLSVGNNGAAQSDPSPVSGSPTPAALYDVSDPFWVGSGTSSPAIARPPSPPAIVTAETLLLGSQPMLASHEREQDKDRGVQLAKPARVRILGLSIPFIRKRTESVPVSMQGSSRSPDGPSSPPPQLLKDKDSRLLRFRWSRHLPGAGGQAEAGPLETAIASSRNSSENVESCSSGESAGRLRLDSSSPSSVGNTSTPPSSVAGGSTDAFGSPLGTPTKTKAGPYPLLITSSGSPLRRAQTPPSPTESLRHSAPSSPTLRQLQAEQALVELGMQVPRPLHPSAPTRPLFLENPVSFLHHTFNGGRHGQTRRVHYAEVHRPGRPQWEVSVYLDGSKVAEASADARKDAKTRAAEAAIRNLGLKEGQTPVEPSAPLPIQPVRQSRRRRRSGQREVHPFSRSSPSLSPRPPIFAPGDVSPLLLASHTEAVPTLSYNSYIQHFSAQQVFPASSLQPPPPVPVGAELLGTHFISSQSGSQQKPVFHLWIMQGTACVGYGRGSRKAMAEAAARSDLAETRRTGRSDTESIPFGSFRGVLPLPQYPRPGRYRSADQYQVLSSLFFLDEELPRLVFWEVPPHPEEGTKGWVVTVLVDGTRRGSAEDPWRSRARALASAQVLEFLKEIQAHSATPAVPPRNASYPSTLGAWT